MKRKNEAGILRETIVLLHNRQALELILLKEQFHLTYESFKPINLVKTTLHEVATSAEIKDNVLNNVIGLATGYLSKKLLIGSSHNPFKKMVGAFLQFTISNIVSKHPDPIKSTGEVIIKRIFKSINQDSNKLSVN